MIFAEREAGVLDRLLTISKPELLDNGDDQRFRKLLYDYFAFGQSLEQSRMKFATFVGLSATQYMTMIAIAHAPDGEPLGVRQIAERLHLSGAFVTIEVNKLVADGLVDKAVHPGDARRVQLTVTAAGKAKLERLAEFQRPVNDALFAGLSREESEQLSRLLARLADNGGRAVKLASHLEATIDLGQDLDAGPAVNKPGRRRKA